MKKSTSKSGYTVRVEAFDFNIKCDAYFDCFNNNIFTAYALGNRYGYCPARHCDARGVQYFSGLVNLFRNQRPAIRRKMTAGIVGLNASHFFVGRKDTDKSVVLELTLRNHSRYESRIALRSQRALAEVLHNVPDLDYLAKSAERDSAFMPALSHLGLKIRKQ